MHDQNIIRFNWIFAVLDPSEEMVVFQINLENFGDVWVILCKVL